MARNLFTLFCFRRTDVCALLICSCLNSYALLEPNGKRPFGNIYVCTHPSNTEKISRRLRALRAPPWYGGDTSAPLPKSRNCYQARLRYVGTAVVLDVYQKLVASSCNQTANALMWRFAYQLAHTYRKAKYLIQLIY